MAQNTVLAKSNGTKTEKFYCVKCRKNLVQTQYHLVQWPNGRHAIVAKCPECGTNMPRVVSDAYAAEMKK